MADVRTCSKCGVEKPLTVEYWYRNKASAQGFRTDCKACVVESTRKYREANREKERERTRKWREANPEKSRGSTRKWREANPEYHRKYREANREKLREYQRKWRERNRTNGTGDCSNG